MGERILTAKEIAQWFGVSNSTARGRFAGAELRRSELGQPYRVAPESSVKDFVPPKPGPVPKAPESKPARRELRKKAEVEP
jgi:hypothetical protein